MQKSIAADAEVDEDGLDARFEIDDFSFVDVADIVVLARPFDVQLFKPPVFDDRDPTFLGLRCID